MAEERGADLCNVECCAAGHHAGPDAEGQAALIASTVHLHHILFGRRRKKDAGRIRGLSSAAAMEQTLFSVVRDCEDTGAVSHHTAWQHEREGARWVCCLSSTGV